jgi:hypothetical protein
LVERKKLMIYGFSEHVRSGGSHHSDRNSTNAIDLQRAAQDLGHGEPLKIMVTVVTASPRAVLRP